MYRGKHYIQKEKKLNKSVVLIVSLLLLTCISVSGVVAFLMDATNPVINIFNPAKVTTYVNETIDGSAKTNVKIQNTGNTSAWIRATYVVTWKNVDGNVYGKAPVAGTDYTVPINGQGWIQGSDGFYYYTEPVAPGAETNNLINSIQPEGTPPAGFTLNVEILGSGIQSSPVSVFNSEWASSGLTATQDAIVDKRSSGGN